MSGQPTNEQLSLFAVLRVLSQRGDKWRKTTLKDTAASKKVNDALRAAQKSSFLTEDEVRGKTFIENGEFVQDRYILMEQPDKQPSTICAVSCVWDFRAEAVDFSGYLGIWMPSIEVLYDESGNASKPIVFLGYRFETPDFQGTKHKFFHSQPCRSMDRARKPIPLAVPHHPKMPTFPLLAEEPADLLVCMCVSLYGRDIIKELVLELGTLSPPRVPSDYVAKLKNMV